jgi:hypothetical protein
LKSSGEKWRGQTSKEFNNIWYVASRDQYATFMNSAGESVLLVIFKTLKQMEETVTWLG